MIEIRNYLSNLRYNVFVSSILVFLLNPLYVLSIFISRWVQKKIKVNRKEIRFYENLIRFPSNVGINILSNIYWRGEDGFEPLTSKTLVCFFRRSDVFLDIGSNFGFYSVLAQKVNNEIVVFGFEPLLNIYEDNLKFHRANQTNNQITYNIALSNTNGELNFYVPDSSLAESEVTTASLEKDFFYNHRFMQRQITVKTMTLDSFLVNEDGSLLGKRLILKIDVEGHELSVLEGGLNFLTRLRPVVVIEIEKSYDNLSSIYSLVSLLKYELFVITNVGYFRCTLETLRHFRGGRDFLLLPGELSIGREYFPINMLEYFIYEKQACETLNS